MEEVTLNPEHFYSIHCGLAFVTTSLATKLIAIMVGNSQKKGEIDRAKPDGNKYRLLGMVGCQRRVYAGRSKGNDVP